MNKKIIVFLVFVCFCFCVIPAFAANNTANPVKPPSEPGIKFTLLKLEYDDYVGKEIYVRCRVIPWAQEKYIVYQGPDIFILENKIKNFSPKPDDDVYLKVKVCKKDYVMYLDLIEGKILEPANAIITKQGKVIIKYNPYPILVLEVSKDEQYELGGDWSDTLRDNIGNMISAEGKIREGTYGVTDKTFVVVKYKVLK